MGPVSHLGNTDKLTLSKGVRVSRPLEPKRRRSVPASHLSYGLVGKGEITPTHFPAAPHHLWQVKELALSL